MYVQDHETRTQEICDYIDILPEVRQRNLTREEIRNIFLNTFPQSWQDSFKNTHDVQKCIHAEDQGMDNYYQDESRPGKFQA